MRGHFVNLCDESAAALPATGKSAFIRRAILAYAEGLAPAKSEEPPAPVEWVRDGVRHTIRRVPGPLINLRYRPDGSCINPPLWLGWEPLNVNQGFQWERYVNQWAWFDYFPGPLEWAAMGEPLKPEESHRRIAPPAPSQGEGAREAAPVDPAPVDPAPAPAPAPADAAIFPLPCGGVSLTVLDEV